MEANQNQQTPNVTSNPVVTNSPITAPKIEATSKPIEAIQNPAAVKDLTKYLVNVQCAIRRKPGLTGLPGSDPNERIYKLSAALSASSGKNLKGIETSLEQLLLPRIVAVSNTDPKFTEACDAYWGNISTIIPADEPYQKESEKGKVLKFSLRVVGKRLKEVLDNENDPTRKVDIISEALLNGNAEFADEDRIADFLLLAFALKNKDVAKEYSMLLSSPKIKFYIYNKASATKASYDKVQLKQKANEFFALIQDDDKKLDTMLVMFNLLPSDFETTIDKILALDEAYTANEESMKKFVSLQDDTDLDIKYLIKLAVKENKLKNPVNTDAYYYNDNILIGRTLTEAIAYLKDNTPESTNVRFTLEKELKIK